MRARARFAVSAIALCAFLSGCISAARYPAGWAPVAQGPADCAELSGLYENAGMIYKVEQMFGTTAYPHDTHLVRLFFNAPERTLSNPAAPVRVRIDAGTSGRLTVVAVFKDGREVPVTLYADKGEFACSEGRIQLTTNEAALLWFMLGWAAGKTTSTLSRATDGSLIVESRFWAVGTALIWTPIGFSERNWSRFAVPTDGEAPAK